MRTTRKFSANGDIVSLAIEKARNPVIFDSDGKLIKKISLDQLKVRLAKGDFSQASASTDDKNPNDISIWKLQVKSGPGKIVEFFAPTPKTIVSLATIASAKAASPSKPVSKVQVRKLMDAIAAGNLVEARALAPIAARGEIDGSIPISKAAREGSREMLEIIIPHAARDASGQLIQGVEAMVDALHAHESNVFEAVQILLPLCDIKAFSVDGETALMVAARSSNPGPFMGSIKVVDLLIPGSDIEAVDADGMTALMHAAKRGRFDAVESLLAAGADPNKIDGAGYTALMRACAAIGDNEPLYAHFPSVIKQLAPVTDSGVQDGDGNTALLLASGKDGIKSKDFAKMVFSDALTLPNKAGETALTRACAVGNAGHAKVLIAGSDANHRMPDGKTAMHLAARHGHADCFIPLMGHSNPNAQDADGRTPLMLVLIGCRDILTRGNLIPMNYIRSILRLVPASDINVQDKDGRSAFMHALGVYVVEIAELMLPRADLNLRDNDGNTALLMLLRERNDWCDSLFEPLLRGSDANLANKAGATPLMSAHKPEQFQAILSKHGVDPDLQDEDGYTALMWAARAGDSDKVEALLPVSNLLLRNKKKQKASGCAEAREHDELAVRIRAEEQAFAERGILGKVAKKPKATAKTAGAKKPRPRGPRL